MLPGSLKTDTRSLKTGASRLEALGPGTERPFELPGKIVREDVDHPLGLRPVELLYYGGLLDDLHRRNLRRVDVQLSVALPLTVQNVDILVGRPFRGVTPKGNPDDTRRRVVRLLHIDRGNPLHLERVERRGHHLAAVDEIAHRGLLERRLCRPGEPLRCRLPCLGRGITQRAVDQCRNRCAVSDGRG